MIISREFNERQTLSKFYLDIDRDFFNFTRSLAYVDLIDRIRACTDPEDRRVFIRQSAQRRTHVKIELATPITLFECLAIRAYLGDDASRIAHDLSRYLQFQDIGQTGRIFDEKFIGAALHKAGEWEVVPV